MDWGAGGSGVGSCRGSFGLGGFVVVGVGFVDMVFWFFHALGLASCRCAIGTKVPTTQPKSPIRQLS